LKGFISSFALLLFFSPVGKCQEKPLESLKVSSNVTFGYNGSIVYPGLRGGIEYPINKVELTKYRGRRSVRHYSKFRYVSAELGFYHHISFHDNFYLLAGWRTRRQGSGNFFREFSSGLGYSHTFLAGETYKVDNYGNISINKWAGYNYLMCATGGGLGYTFRSKIATYLRGSLLFMFPSNNYFYLRPTVELGLKWQPVHFLMARIKYVQKLKGLKQ